MNIINLLRLYNPLPIFLLFYPCFFGLFLSQKGNFQWKLAALFFVGATVMRSAGCLINDLFDKDLDIAVERTKNRPLASKSLSILSALIILGLLLSCSLFILSHLNINSILIGISAMPIVITYPLLKRFTYFPQVCLGIVWNIGILVSYLNVSNHLTIELLLAYVGCIFWTIGYDTIYAFSDIIDDKKIGVKSMAIFLENKNPKLWLSIFYYIFIFCMILATFFAKKLNLVMIICYVISSGLLYKQVKSVDISGNISNIGLFKSNFWVGLTISIGIISQIH
jgi:4-hydroxybenzoate polyprenyltransferase